MITLGDTKTTTQQRVAIHNCMGQKFVLGQKQSDCCPLTSQGCWNLLWQKQHWTVPPLSLLAWDLSASYFFPGLQSSASWVHCDESRATSFPSRPLPSALPAPAHDIPLARRQAPPSQNGRRGPAEEFAAER